MMLDEKDKIERISEYVDDYKGNFFKLLDCPDLSFQLVDLIFTCARTKNY